MKNSIQIPLWQTQNFIGQKSTISPRKNLSFERKNKCFPLGISLVNLKKSSENGRFVQIYKGKPYRKYHILSSLSP